MKNLINYLSITALLLSPGTTWTQQVQVFWEAPVAISSNTAYDQVPTLDVGPGPVSGERIHVAYSQFDSFDNVWEIRYAWKDVSAGVWNSAFASDKSTSGWPNSYNWEPSIKAISGGMVYIAYRASFQSPPGSDDEILQINNSGGAFNLPVYITNNSTDDKHCCLAVESNGTPHVAYAAYGGTGPTGDFEIWFDQVQVTTNSTHDEYPSLFIDSNNFSHIAFAGHGPGGDYEIWYINNTTGSWPAPTLVNENNYHEIKPSLWIDGNGSAHIAWEGNIENDYDIFYSNNTSGTFLVTPTRVTAENTDELEPSLVIGPGNYANIAYQWLTGNPADEEIYFTHNMNGTFTSQVGLQKQITTGISSDNQFPSLDIDANSYLHLAYQGFQESDTEIFYSKTTFPVPVELVSFKASIKDGVVILSWRTITESNNYGFDVQRSRGGKSFRKINFLAGHGTTTIPRTYIYKDSKIEDGIYYYRLKQIDYDGSFSLSEILKVEIKQALTFQLHQNFPNPFNPETKIGFQVAKSSLVQLVIYNLQGQKVEQLIKKKYAAGEYAVNFNKSDLPSGVYLYRIKMSDFFAVKKMIILE